MPRAAPVLLARWNAPPVKSEMHFFTFPAQFVKQVISIFKSIVLQTCREQHRLFSTKLSRAEKKKEIMH